MSADADLEQLWQAYRASRRTMWAHGLFLAACVVLVVVIRRIFNLPPQVLATVFIVALLVFARDIMQFMRLRSKILQATQDSNSS